MKSTDRPRGWSTEEPSGEYVPRIDRPVFSGRGEMEIWEHAWRSTPRRPTETLAERMERVVAKVRGQERVPWEEG